jgi:hypothetical protein
MAAVLSLEWSSTTITSSGLRIWRLMAANRWGRVAASLRAGISTDTVRRCRGAQSGSSGRLRASILPSSQRTSSDTSSQPMSTQDPEATGSARAVAGDDPSAAAGPQQTLPDGSQILLANSCCSKTWIAMVGAVLTLKPCTLARSMQRKAMNGSA